ncbi:Aspartate/glutamate/uridylate kinase [Glomus cerebriforme]|uniref:Aspartokinase n=1 Tax=Glomus cerebriforme TaxID=658196 RepID=A0A397SP79_9GLOM|nr:Aspartate/glutamate/uridylate kinase [Glomus cerebriforme]
MAALPVSLISNKDCFPWVVQKFGGTSVGKFLENITGTIVKSHLETHRVALVCSARSGKTKAEGTTNRLFKASEEALKHGSKEYVRIVDEIYQDHVKASREIINNNEIILNELEKHLFQDCAKLKRFLEAAQLIDEISPRLKDIIIGVGEKLSCRIITAALQDKGINAEFINLENIIEQEFDANNLNQKFYDYLAKRIAEVVSKCGNRIPVVTGYFGIVPGSILNSVGRGYTDLCAALLAVGLRAKELQIWKEVDGIYTADPRKVPKARLLPIITPEEASELTYYGAEVIHPYTMEQVIRSNIPIRIKNVMNPIGEGTIIFPDAPKKSKNGFSKNGYHERHPTAVTIKNNIIVLNIHSNRKIMSHGFFAQIFAALDTYGIVVDLISTSEVHVSMALGAEIIEKDLQKALNELEKLGTVDVLEGMAILSLVGKQMKNMVGIAGKMFTTLAEANVNIEMISQGASEINISCVIDEFNADKALNVIHEHLLPIFTYQIPPDLSLPDQIVPQNPIALFP